MMMDAPRGQNIEQKTDLFIKLIQTESKQNLIELNWTKLHQTGLTEDNKNEINRFKLLNWLIDIKATYRQWRS